MLPTRSQELRRISGKSRTPDYSVVEAICKRGVDEIKLLFHMRSKIQSKIIVLFEYVMSFVAPFPFLRIFHRRPLPKRHVNFGLKKQCLVVLPRNGLTTTSFITVKANSLWWLIKSLPICSEHLICLNVKQRGHYIAIRRHQFFIS